MFDSISVLLGKTLKSVEKKTNVGGEDEIIFAAEDGPVYRLYHEQDCCECVTVEDINGELTDLVGSPITMAEETQKEDEEAGESGSWTFYRLATAKGYVTIRWYGSSNGYYSEAVSFGRVN